MKTLQVAIKQILSDGYFSFASLWEFLLQFVVSDDDICTCDNTDGHLGKRWLGLSLLAVLVPCLCLYPLFTACHGCGQACKMCGGRHQS